MSKCCVCGAESQTCNVKSTLSKNELDYCVTCLANKYESYDELVNFGWEYDVYPQHYRRLVVYPSLTYYNKNIKQFNEDVRRQKDVKKKVDTDDET